MKDDHLTDRMPAVAQGREVWTAGEEHHLRGCPACAAAWQVVRLGAALGTEVGAAVDPERVLAGVTRRLREPLHRPRRMPRWGWFVPIAAAAGLMLVLLSSPRGTVPPMGNEAALLPELVGLEVEELESVFEVLPEVAGAVEGVPVPGLGDLEADQLESLISSLEG